MKPSNVPVRWRLRPGERRIILLVGDLLVGYLSLLISLYIWGRGDKWLSFSKQFILQRPAEWYWLLPLMWLVMLVEIYDVRRSSHREETLRSIFVVAAISFIFYSLIYIVSTPRSLPRVGVASFIVAATLLTTGWRLLYISIFTAPQFVRRVLIIGAGKTGSELVKVVKTTWPPPFYVVGLIDDDPQKIGTEIGGFPVLGSSQQLLQIIAEQKISDLVLAITGEMNSGLFKAILDAAEQEVEVTSMPVVYEEILGRVPILLLESDWIIRSFVNESHTGAFYDTGKRLIDIAGGLLGTLCLGIFYPFIGLAIALESGFPVIFVQKRLGKNGRSYTIIKFRTMVKNPVKSNQPRMTQEHDERITRVGRFLRKTHLDEWPQFINVLRGEMSLVGPRAEQIEVVEDLQEKIPFYRARLLVKPGITGWAQINFGYAATIEEMVVKLEYDLYYIKHRSLVTDIVILLRTFGIMFRFSGK